jgi:hypothetical protein
MMRKEIFVVVLLFIVSFSVSWPGALMDVEKIETKIDAAMSHFFGPATPGADSKKGFIYLIDAIEIAAPHTGFGEEFNGKIKEANALFKNTSIFNEEGVAFLHEGYTAINSGKNFEMPEEISSIEDARDYARKQVISAKTYLKKKDYDGCVKLLMEVAVMVATPMIKKN